MNKQLRAAFNQHYSTKQYEKYLNQFEWLTGIKPGFRIAETPVFIDKSFKKLMLETGEEIIDFICSPNFKSLTEKAIPESLKFGNEDEHPQMMVIDFGICKDEKGNYVPKLIELQGFPSLFAFQYYSDLFTQQLHPIPDNFDSYLNGFNSSTYLTLLEEILLQGHAKENVVLLEFQPEKQKTAIDFLCTEKLLGIKTVCLTTLTTDGKNLYYTCEDKKIKIEVIFNRVIFEDIKNNLFNIQININENYDVQWIPHPNWFYRISKYTLPFLKGDCIPESYFLNEVKEPLALENYVLKPLFSYAGSGVLIDVTAKDIDEIPDPENWILQEKVHYDPCIVTPEGSVKAEVRLFYFWKKDWKRPLAIHNLARLSKGDMIGTRYNSNHQWVGGTIAYFEKD